MGWPCCTVGAERETACGWANTRNTGAHVPPRSLVLSSPAVLQLRGGGKQKPDVTTGGEAPKPGLDVAYCATCGVPPEYCGAVKCPRVATNTGKAAAQTVPAAAEPGTEQAAAGGDTGAGAGAVQAGAASEKAKEGGGEKGEAKGAGETGGKVHKPKLPQVVIKVARRGSKKHVTTVAGLEASGGGMV
ncbi:hypothetical protein T484DRAFT_1832283 [Baffinella frigidus]|nr:hypothetical protein T484DRAFT_1832283 [Cryptophyta sp. CCMP2293]